MLYDDIMSTWKKKFTQKRQHTQKKFLPSQETEEFGWRYNNFPSCVMEKWHEGQFPLLKSLTFFHISSRGSSAEHPESRKWPTSSRINLTVWMCSQRYSIIEWTNLGYTATRYKANTCQTSRLVCWRVGREVWKEGRKNVGGGGRSKRGECNSCIFLVILSV